MPIGEKVLRQAVVAETLKEFSFAKYESPTVLIKNETDGGILFCDAGYDEDKAYRIPAHSWQVIAVNIKIGEAPTFSVMPEVDGYVEIDFGSPLMGSLDIFSTLDRAGMIPHVISVITGDETMLAMEITRLHGQSVNLETPVEIGDGATIFNGDFIKLTVMGVPEGSHAVLTVNGDECSLLNNAVTIVASGDTYVVTAAVADE
jgi:hypothetical protein